MIARSGNPLNSLTPALEAIGNLLLPELNSIFSGGWSAALSAHTEINVRPINVRRGAFYRHFLPLQNDLVRVLADSYRRYFKLALAHPNETGHDPRQWALGQLQSVLGMALEWIHNWFILACDGENQFVRRVGSTEFVPGETVSVSIPTAATPYPSPESWRAPAWLFAVAPHVGIGPLKTKNVPANNSEERLGAAHTRLLLKGARRVFLGQLGAAIETVRNEEIAAAGAIQAATVESQAREANKRAKYWLKGTEGLGPKTIDLSKYMDMDGLTDKQRLAFSLKNEYGLGPAEVASRMGLDRKTAYEHLEAANRKINQSYSNAKRRARARNTPE